MPPAISIDSHGHAAARHFTIRASAKTVISNVTRVLAAEAVKNGLSISGDDAPKSLMM
jgi:hypothetical protein